MKRFLRNSVLMSLLVFAAFAAQAASVTVELTNTTHGLYFTPLLITAHPGNEHLFQAGFAASGNLQAMAEGGDVGGLVTAVGGVDADTVENPAAGLLAPGQTIMATLDTMASGNTHLSLVAMLLPTNDGFVGLDGLQIPTAAGTYVYELNGYDAGTEANDELLNTLNGGVPGTAGIPGDPTGAAGSGGSGVALADTNASVHIHRGNLGDANPVGGTSDLDSSVHRWLNPVARMRLTVH